MYSQHTPGCHRVQITENPDSKWIWYRSHPKARLPAQDEHLVYDVTDTLALPSPHSIFLGWSPPKASPFVVAS